jgi:hypothetical protein
MNPNNLVDYAKPMINIEFMVRVTHDLCLANNYDKAAQIVTELVAEARILQNTLKLMAEEQAKVDARGLRV